MYSLLLALLNCQPQPKPPISRRPIYDLMYTATSTIITTAPTVSQLPVNLKPLPPNPDLLLNNEGISQNRDSWRGVKFYHVTPFGYYSESETSWSGDDNENENEVDDNHKADL